MTLPMSVLLSVSGLALLFSIGALLATALLWDRFRNSSAERLSARLSEVESLTETLSADFRNLRAARNMAAHRARNRSPESSAPAENGAERDEAAEKRAELNRRLAAGEFKPRVT